MSTKKQRAEFRQGAEKLIRKYGGKETANSEGIFSSYPWAIETEYGLLELDIDDFEGRSNSRKWIGTVFARFDDLERLPRFLNLNPYSGKWNHHYIADSWTAEAALLNFDGALSMVITQEE